MSLKLRILKVKSDFLNMYNAFAEKFKIKKIDQLSETTLIIAREEIMSLRLNKFHTDAFNEIIIQLINVLDYSETYSKREIRLLLSKIESYIRIINSHYLKSESEILDSKEIKKEETGNLTEDRKGNKQRKIPAIDENEERSKVQSKLKERDKKQYFIHESITDSLSNKEPYGNLYSLLQTISDKSKEAIMRPDEFSDVKDYLHIETEIQKELESVIKEVNESSKSQLIILCGNVGDGKSHLISYLKEKNPEWFNNITIYNDATESNHPSKTAIETLEEELKAFDDDNIDRSNHKMILAINIGVLNNFVTEMKRVDKYSRLISFLENSIIYNESDIKKGLNNRINIVSFFEYPNIRLYEEEIKSPFYEELFERLFSTDKDNIFYQAYLKDKSISNYNIVHHNYELMMNKNIRAKLLFLLYRIQIQYNVIVSVRALNNFLFDIIVPEDIDKTTHNDYIPFLLFDNKNDTDILRSIKQLDPILNINNSFNKEFNQLNIAYYNANNYLETSKRLINDESALLTYKNLLESLEVIPYSLKEHNIYVVAFLRMLYLYNTDRNITDDDIFEEYILLLTAIDSFTEKPSSNNRLKINRFMQLVIETTKKWNGMLNEKQMFIDNDMNSSIATAIGFDLRFDSIRRENYSIYIIFRETNSNLKHKLIVDYNLFKLLRRVNYGYILKEKDKHNHIYFQQFVNSIIYDTPALESTIIVDKITNKQFELFDNGLGIEIKEGDD